MDSRAETEGDASEEWQGNFMTSPFQKAVSFAGWAFLFLALSLYGIASKGYQWMEAKFGKVASGFIICIAGIGVIALAYGSTIRSLYRTVISWIPA